MIRFEGVQFSYVADRPALSIARLTIDAGLTLVVGPNGAGKSTMLRLIAGVERPTSGTVLVNGHDLWKDEVAARRGLAYVPEHPEMTPYATIGDTALLVAGLRGVDPLQAVDALHRAGVLGVAHRTVRELSMGQRRRALLATALIGDARILILDEPLETMDQEMRGFIHDLALERRAAGAAVLVATHEIEPFAEHADAVIAVRDGQVAHEALRDVPAASRLARITALARGAAVG
jgi:ABC-2 type transport system ATP-binding protein